jgi:hypothetical protein
MLAATKSQDPKFLVEADAESKLCKIPTPQVLHKRHHKFCKKTINYTHPNFPIILPLTFCYWLLSRKGHKERESK